MSDLIQPVAAQTPHQRSVPRGRIVVAAIVALLLVIATGVGAFRSLRVWRAGAARRAAMAEIKRIGAPAEFTATRPRDSGSPFDDYTGTASRSYAAQVKIADIPGIANAWLARAGYGPELGQEHAQTCGPSDLPDRLTCGNFFRNGKQWRVWLGVELSNGSGYSASGRSAKDARRVGLTVFVQPRRALLAAFTDVRLNNGSIARSPGIPGAAPPGTTRTVLDWTNGPFEIANAAFAPNGELFVRVSSSDRLAAGTVMPVLVPAAAGKPVRQLRISHGPTVPEELGLDQFDGTGGGKLYLPLSALFAADGSLYIQYIFGIARIAPDGATTIVLGHRRIADGSLDGQPALGPAPEIPLTAQPFAVTADESVWLAGRGLIRLGGGVLHQLTHAPVTSVVADPHGGVYFATATQVFHHDGTGEPRLVAGQATAGHGGHDGPAAQVQFDAIQSLAVTPDGSVFVHDNGYLIRVRPNGTTQHIAGIGPDLGVNRAGYEAFCAKPIPPDAARMSLGQSTDVVASPAGNLYVVDCNRLVQIGF